MFYIMCYNLSKNVNIKFTAVSKETVQSLLDGEAETMPAIIESTWIPELSDANISYFILNTVKLI